MGSCSGYLQNKTTTPLQLLAVHIFFQFNSEGTSETDWADIEHESLELYIDAPASLGWWFVGYAKGFCWVCVHRSYTLEKLAWNPSFRGCILPYTVIIITKNLEVVGHSSLAKFQLKIDNLVVFYFDWFQEDLSHIRSLYPDDGVFDLTAAWRDLKLSFDIQDLKVLTFPIHRSG